VAWTTRVLKESTRGTTGDGFDGGVERALRETVATQEIQLLMSPGAFKGIVSISLDDEDGAENL